MIQICLRPSILSTLRMVVSSVGIRSRTIRICRRTVGVLVLWMRLRSVRRRLVLRRTVRMRVLRPHHQRPSQASHTRNNHQTELESLSQFPSFLASLPRPFLHLLL